MLVNVLIKKPIFGKGRTLLIQDVEEVLVREDVALLMCRLDDGRVEEVIYPVCKILSISEQYNDRTGKDRKTD